MDHQALFEERIGRLLRWERAKRREQILVSALVYSLLLSLATAPAGALFPPWAGPVTATPVLLCVLILLLSLSRPWGVRESLGTVLSLDKKLRLQERALTAWEIVRRGVRQPAERLVIEKAASDLQTVNVESLFKRRFSWQFYLTPPLFALWLAAAWFGVDFFFDQGEAAKAGAVAEELKDYAENIRAKAEADQLAEARKAADTLESIAKRSIGKDVGAVGMRNSLREAVQGMRAMALGAMGDPGGLLPQMSQGALRDLKSELAELQQSLARSGTLSDKGIVGSDVLDRLDRLAPYRGGQDERSGMSRDLSKKEALEFLEQLDAKRRAEQDRRALMETQAFLMRLLDGMKGDTQRPSESRESREGASSSARDDAQQGSLPGDRPGSLGPKIQFPQFKAQAETHLKGLLKSGMGPGVTVRAEVTANESKAVQEDVVTRYRRQVEGELASEQIPQELKGTVKSYFLSLGMTGEGETVPR